MERPNELAGKQNLTDEEATKFAAEETRKLSRDLVDPKKGGGIYPPDRNVLVQPGVSHVVVLEGINDIRNSPTTSAADLIVGHRQLIERARTHGLKYLRGDIVTM